MSTNRPDFSLVAVDHFIQATRDSGYKGTTSAIAELVDNSLQAAARRIAVRVVSASNSEGRKAIEVFVQDDGTGMGRHVLRQALRFGGSTRFNDRNGLGRYGMGLPNSSLSQARRVTVYSWRADSPIYRCYLDVDEIKDGLMKRVPAPRRARLPVQDVAGKSGTMVHWSRCDRLDNRRISTTVRKLLASLGRQFRYFIWDGVEITVNDVPVEPIDPLFLHRDTKHNGATLFGEELEYEIQAMPENGAGTAGRVHVRFSELPVHQWHDLPNKDKRRLGIAEGGGVSVIRGGREVDHGWFFLGGKRRENYDDWWRCEIRFEPILDEAFGISHTKQQIRPKTHLLEALSPDIESVARALNARARKSHVAAKAAGHSLESESLASEREKLLDPLPDIPRKRDLDALTVLPVQQLKQLKVDGPGRSGDGHLKYKIVEAQAGDTSFFSYARDGEQLVLALNPSHPFYKHVYRHLAKSTLPGDRQLRTQLELLLFALARSEAKEQDPDVLTLLARHRLAWSDTLATFLNG